MDWLNQAYPVLFIDLGCGPLTSGLALADFYFSKSGEKLKFNYWGIDIATSMQDKAKQFSKTTIFSDQCEWYFSDSWNNQEEVLESIQDKATKIIINASYLFASSSLDEKDLAGFINHINEKYKYNETIFLFQNPVNLDKSKKFTTFKKNLKTLKSVKQFEETVFYQNKPNSYFEPRKETVHFEILSNH